MEDEMLTFKKNALLGKISAEPLCMQYKQAWRACGDDKESLVKLALMQQSIPYFSHACYEHLGLTKEYILENFSEYINGKRVLNDVEGVNGYTYQLYVAFNGDLKAIADVTSLMWCISTQVLITATKCPVFYISNSSDVHISCEGYNSPKIYLFDDSVVTIEDCDDTCGVIIYKYSDNATVNTGKFCLKEPKVFNKELRL
jgi:hypothetical protein